MLKLFQLCTVKKDFVTGNIKNQLMRFAFIVTLQGKICSCQLISLVLSDMLLTYRMCDCNEYLLSCVFIEFIYAFFPWDYPSFR
jgi:hypothetical protein